MRSQREAAGDTIRFGNDLGTDDKIGIADVDRVAGLEPQTYEQRLFHHGAADLCVAGDGRLQRHGGRHHGLAQ
jgi:hypothetical protein